MTQDTQRRDVFGSEFLFFESGADQTILTPAEKVERLPAKSGQRLIVCQTTMMTGSLKTIRKGDPRKLAIDTESNATQVRATYGLPSDEEWDMIDP